MEVVGLFQLLKPCLIDSVLNLTNNHKSTYLMNKWSLVYQTAVKVVIHQMLGVTSNKLVLLLVLLTEKLPDVNLILSQLAELLAKKNHFHQLHLAVHLVFLNTQLLSTTIYTMVTKFTMLTVMLEIFKPKSWPMDQFKEQWTFMLISWPINLESINTLLEIT